MKVVAAVLKEEDDEALRARCLPVYYTIFNMSMHWLPDEEVLQCFFVLKPGAERQNAMESMWSYVKRSYHSFVGRGLIHLYYLEPTPQECAYMYRQVLRLIETLACVFLLLNELSESDKLFRAYAENCKKLYAALRSYLAGLKVEQ